MSFKFDFQEFGNIIAAILKDINSVENLEKQINSKIQYKEAEKDDLNKKLKTAEAKPTTSTNPDTREEEEDPLLKRAKEEEIANITNNIQKNKNELSRLYRELAELQSLIGLLTGNRDKLQEAKNNFDKANENAKGILNQGTDCVVAALRLGPDMLKQSASDIGDAWKNGKFETGARNINDWAYKEGTAWLDANMEDGLLKDVADGGAYIAHNFASGVITLVFSGDKEGSGKDGVTTKTNGKIDTEAKDNKTNPREFKLFGFKFGGSNDNEQSSTSGTTEPKESASMSNIKDEKASETSSNESSGNEKTKTYGAQATQKSETPTKGEGKEKVESGETEGGETKGGESLKKSRKYGDSPADVANKILTDKNAYAQIGNGEERKNNLKDAGYTDEEIKMSQAIINKMMDNYKNDNSYRFTLENAQKEETKLEEGEK